MDMKKNRQILDARPLYREILSSGKFVSLKDDERAKIKSAHIVPPKLGKKDFGGVLVEYKTPVYKVG